MHSHFSIREAVRFGWHTTRAHSGLMFQAVLTLFALDVAASIVEKVLEGTLEGTLASILLGVASLFVGTGLTLISLRLAKGEHTSYGDILPQWRLVWRVLASSVLVGLLMLLPVLVGALLITAALFAALGPFLPAILSAATPAAAMLYLLSVGSQVLVFSAVVIAVTIVAVAYIVLHYSMARYAVVDGAGIVASLRRSAAMTKGVKWSLAGFLLALVGLNLLGALAFMVGLLITVPISLLAYAHVYLKLKNRG